MKTIPLSFIFLRTALDRATMVAKKASRMFNKNPLHNSMPPYLQRLYIVFLLLCLAAMTQAAHSRKRVVVRTVAEPRYDRSITTFDQTGRLLQVEYGMEAATRGESIVGLIANSTIYVAVKKSSYSKVHRIDNHLWLFTSGLSGDARALAASLRFSCQQHRHSYGEAPTVKQAAREAAALQHELTRTGGARPLGCSAVVAGIDAAEHQVSLFRTDPGGILEDCLYCAAGKHQDKIMNRLADRCDDEFLTANSTKIVSELVACVKGDDKKVDSLVDVWILEPDARRRGNMRATCLLNVNNKGKMDETIARAWQGSCDAKHVFHEMM